MTGELDAGTPGLKGLWTLEVRGTEGFREERTLDWSAAGPEPLNLEIPREEDAFLLLTPLFPEADCHFYPLGAYLPFEESRAAAVPRNGAAVSLLVTLLRADRYPEGLNAERFLAEMAAEEDPWLCDRDLLLTRLQRREMRIWYIRSRPLFPITLSLPEGRWYGPSLVQAPLESVDGTAAELELPEGWSFLYCPERASLIELEVNDQGEVYLYAPDS